jgi:hypothetical protein
MLFSLPSHFKFLALINQEIIGYEEEQSFLMLDLMAGYISDSYTKHVYLKRKVDHWLSPCSMGYNQNMFVRLSR